MAHHPVVRHVVQSPASFGENHPSGEKQLEVAAAKADGTPVGDATAAVDTALLAQRKRISHAVHGGGTAPVVLLVAGSRFERLIDSADDVAAWRDELIASLSSGKR